MNEFNEVVSTGQLLSSSPFHVVTYQEVTISADPNDREIYRQGSIHAGGKWVDTYALSNVGLSKLMNAAGIKGTATRTDNREHPYICAYQFEGSWMQPDSTLLGFTTDYELDLRDYIHINGQVMKGPRFEQAIAAEMERSLEKLFKKELDEAELKGNARLEGAQRLFEALAEEDRKSVSEDAEARALKTIVQMRVHIVSRAQTGAMLRFIRKVLNLKAAYTLEELKHPFRVPRAEFRFDMMERLLGPEKTKELLVAKAAGLLGMTPDQILSAKQIEAPNLPHPGAPNAQPEPLSDGHGPFDDTPSGPPAASTVVESKENPKEPEVFTEGTLTYRKAATGEEVMVNGAWRPAKEKLGRLSPETIADLERKLFNGVRPHSVNHLFKHFQTKVWPELTWEQLGAIYEARIHGKLDPRWYMDENPKTKATAEEARIFAIWEAYKIPVGAKDGREFILNMAKLVDPLCMVLLIEQGWTWEQDHEALYNLSVLLAGGTLTYGDAEFKELVESYVQTKTARPQGN